MSGGRDLHPLLRAWLRLSSGERGYGLVGDIQEMYALQREKHGRVRAGLWLWGQVARALLHALADRLGWGIRMLGEAARLQFRIFRRQKLYTLINLAGLAVGLACCILILAWIRFELSFDDFHRKADRIHRLVVNGELSNRPFNLASTNGAQAPGVSRAVPEIENFVRFTPLNRIPVRYEDRVFFESGILWADASVFEIFSFPLVSGDPETALVPAFSAVLTREAAERYFGEEDPIGRVLTVNGHDHFTVTGVAADVPDNSHLRFDMLFSFQTYQDRNPWDFARWMGNFGFYSYLLLKEGADPARVEEKFIPLVEKNIGPVLKIVGGDLAFRLQPLKSIHLHSHLQGEISSNPDPAFLAIFAMIAFFILALACINYMNLATARSTGRAREVGIRKVHGADRGRLIGRFLAESALQGLAALVLALILVEISLPAFRALAGRNLDVPYLDIPWLIPALLGLALLAGLAGGSYPAFVLAGFQPIAVLRGTFSGGPGNRRFRAVLVTFQFTLSLILLIGTGIIFRQLHFMKNQRLGFDQRRVVVLRLNNQTARDAAPAIKRELLALSNVESVGAASHVPGWGARHNVVLPEGFSPDDSIMMGIIDADFDYLETLGVKFFAGRGFSREYPTDPHKAMILNRAAARAAGWDDPLGKTMRELDGLALPRVVVGMVEDYFFQDVRSAVEPLVIFCEPEKIGAMAVRLGPGSMEGHIRALRTAWAAAAPDTAFDYYFLDRSLENQYNEEQRLGMLFSTFSGLAVFIACLGLFGLAAFTAERRAKEIGIRRVLGASPAGMVLLLSRELLQWLGVAALIAWPAAFWMASMWLSRFAFRSRIDPLLFAGSAGLVMAVGFLTTAFQSIRAALSDPAATLKCE